MQALLILGFSVLGFLTGLGFLLLLFPRNTLKASLEVHSLAFLFGLGTSSLLLFLLELAGLPLKAFILWTVQAAFILAGFFFRRHSLSSYLKSIRVTLRLEDILVGLVILFFGLVSVWRSYFYPPVSYDALMGIDLVAKYAVRDGSIAGSALFKEVLPFTQGYTNQLFYAPFTMLMQVWTRSIGIDFGQVWLGLMSIAFLLFFYSVAKKQAHTAVAFFALVFILLVPEFFAYSFVLQTDYVNAVFFFVGVYYFFISIKEEASVALVLSIAGMFFACWSRTETIFFIPFGSIWLLLSRYKKTKAIHWHLLPRPIFFTLIPAIAVLLWSILFVNLYLPESVNLEGQIQPRLNNLAGFIGQNFKDMNTLVIFKADYWNYTVPVFFVFLAGSIVVSINRKHWPKGIPVLFWMVALYVGFHILLILFPAVNIPYTFRRGFFKFIPLMGFYIVLSDVAQLIYRKPLSDGTGK